ncbi:MAG: CopD family protein [Methylibium sp.]|nr:CopD family protein [Methylibium sp.]
MQRVPCRRRCTAVITAIKALHIVALIVWCAGLLALPLLLTKHDPLHSQTAYARLRELSQFAYTAVVTPAAVITIAAGTALIFMRGVFAPWMFAKLAAVGLLVVLHAWQSFVLIKMGETAGQDRAPHAGLMIVLTIPVMAIVLVLVLARPTFSTACFPDWLTAPRDRQLPVDETPI